MKSLSRFIQVIIISTFIISAGSAMEAQQDTIIPQQIALAVVPSDLMRSVGRYLTPPAYSSLMQTCKMNPAHQDNFLCGLISTNYIDLNLTRVSPARAIQLLGIFNTKNIPLKLAFSFLTQVQLTDMLPHCYKVSALKMRAVLGVAGANVIAWAPTLTNLTSLDWSLDYDMGDAGVHYIAASTALTNLESLTMRRINLGNEGFGDLMRTMTLTRLTHLDIGGNNIDDIGLKYVLKLWHMTNLRSLDLSYSKLQDIGAGTLAISPNMTSLKCLNLVHNRIHDGGACAIGNSRFLGNLTRLSLRLNPIGPAGLDALNKTIYLTKLERLDVRSNDYYG